MGRAAHGITKQFICEEMNPTSLDWIDASCLHLKVSSSSPEE